MALDNATAALVARSGGDPKAPDVPVGQLRQARRRDAAAGIPPERFTDVLIPVAGGTIGARVVRPGAPPRGVIVFYHAGGWVLGGLDECEAEAGALAECTGCAVVCPAYRLAPEYRYPTAAEDAWAALRWTAAHTTQITGDPSGQRPLIVAGESAGGNLAAVVARRAAEQGGPGVLLQVLICPVTDSDTSSLSYTDPANQLLLDRDEMIWFWEQYVPDPAARRHPDASPLQAVFLTGVPPAVILTAEHDVLRDDGELYAMRLVQAGVPVGHRRFAGQVHGFLGRIGELPGSADGLAYIAEQVGRALAAP